MLDTLGWLYLRKGLVDRAISLLEEAHAGAPELAEVQLHLALAYRAGGPHRRRPPPARGAGAAQRRPPELRAQIDEALRSLP